MHDIIKKVPIPTAGVALGLAALGGLLQPVTETLHLICGGAALLLVALLVAKIIMFPQLIRDDLQDSILASVSGTVCMVVMQLSTYVAPAAYIPAFALWIAAVVAHLTLIVWFTVQFFRKFKLHEVFPTYFICYVGIVVASVTSPTFGMQGVGQALFWFGFTCYIILLGLVTCRYIKHEIPEAARPLFCIYTAPMSLSIVGYLSVAAEPNMIFVGVMAVLAQILFVMVLSRLPHLLRLKFYPSYAAMTFPFVITATALGKATAFFRTSGIDLPFALDIVFYVETALASIMVIYVLGHFLHFLVRRIEHPQSADVLQENAQISRFSENFRD